MNEKKRRAYENWRERKIQAIERVINYMNQNPKIFETIRADILYSIGNMNQLSGVSRISNKNELLDFIRENKTVTLKMIFDSFELGLPEMKLRIRAFIINQKIWINYDELTKSFSIVGEGQEPSNWKGYREKSKKEDSIATIEKPKSNLIKKAATK